MFLVFQSIFIWAKPLMDWIKAGQGLARRRRQRPARRPGRCAACWSTASSAASAACVVFLPQILILFAFIAVLEDCGYMARAAFLMDRLMARCGLNGKSFIPLLSSVACAVPGHHGGARHREPPRPPGDDPGRAADELLGPAAGVHPADRRVPAGRGIGWWVPGLAMFGLYTLGLVLAPLVALLLKRTLLRGETPVFVMEMPLYKRPSLRMVLCRSLEAGWMFLMRADDDPRQHGLDWAPFISRAAISRLGRMNCRSS